MTATAPAESGWLRSYVALYLTMARVSMIEQFQYRAANYFYMIAMVTEPASSCASTGLDLEADRRARRRQRSRGGLVHIETEIGWSDAAGFVLTIVLGGVTIYCFWLILTTGAFWFVRMEQLQELFTGLYRAGQYPATIYPGWLRFSLTFIVPLAFAITVPSEALTGRLTGLRVLVTVGFTLVLMVVTRLIWRAGLKRYGGASA